MDVETRSLVAECLATPGVAWSLGSFGAIAEFMWNEDEPSLLGVDTSYRVTPRGGILVAPPPAARLVRYATPSRLPERRREEIAICLSAEACSMAGRETVTEIGPDENALCEAERGHILFDIGLGQRQVDACVRSADPETITLLRDAVGHSIFDPGVALMREMPRLSPHRVFVTRCGRIEVFQPIPTADGKSPDGPHTHVLPKLLRSGRTHAANIPIPAGLVPCLTIHLSRNDPDHATMLAQDGA